jgi:hypothetical protein
VSLLMVRVHGTPIVSVCHGGVTMCDFYDLRASALSDRPAPH